VSVVDSCFRRSIQDLNSVSVLIFHKLDYGWMITSGFEFEKRENTV
jgi:hypothetical protein